MRRGRFPLGAMNPRSKAYETKEAIRCGAQEIDMVINIGAVKAPIMSWFIVISRQSWKLLSPSA